MSDALFDKRLRMMEGTYAAALVSFGVSAIIGGFVQLDALRYLFLVLGTALVASPAVGLHKRVVSYVAARTRPSYIAVALFALPAALVVPPLILAFFLWFGVQSGILSLQEELPPLVGAVVMILINLGVLIYNLVESRRKTA